jgi:hypothetical protein
MLALAEGEFAETLTWLADDATTPLAVSVAYAEGEVRFIDSVAVYPDQGVLTEDIGVLCYASVEVDVTLSITTEDGALDESFELAISSMDGLEIGAGETFHHDDMVGSYEFTLMDPSEYDDVNHSLHVNFDEAGCSGSFEAQAEGCDDGCTGDECTCWASMDTVASWPLEDLE